MANNTIAFVVPKGTRDRVIRRFSTYRAAGFFYYYADEPTLVAKSGGLFVPEYDPDCEVRVVTPMRWLAITDKWRDDCNQEPTREDRTMWVDDCTKWLCDGTNISLDDIEIVLTEER